MHYSLLREVSAHKTVKENPKLGVDAENHQGRIVWMMLQSFFDHISLSSFAATSDCQLLYFFELNCCCIAVASGLGFCKHTDLITALDRSAYATCMARCIWGMSLSLSGSPTVSSPGVLPLSWFAGHAHSELHDQTVILKGPEQRVPLCPIVKCCLTKDILICEDIINDLISCACSSLFPPTLENVFIWWRAGP